MYTVWDSYPIPGGYQRDLHRRLAGWSSQILLTRAKVCTVIFCNFIGWHPTIFSVIVPQHHPELPHNTLSRILWLFLVKTHPPSLVAAALYLQHSRRFRSLRRLSLSKLPRRDLLIASGMLTSQRKRRWAKIRDDWIWKAIHTPAMLDQQASSVFLVIKQ